MLTALTLLAQVRPTDTWTGWSMAGGMLLLAAAVALLVAWVVRVVTRR